METLWWVGLFLVGLGLFVFLFNRKKKVSAPVKFIRHKPVKVTTKKTGKRYLVTGGHGFLGSHIVEALLARGEKDIRIFDMAASHLFEEEQRKDNGSITFIKGNILDKKQIEAALEGVDTVFHTAALVNFWERLPFQKDKHYAINFVGTQNMLECSGKAGVKQFIYMSSASIVVSSSILNNPIRGGDESISLPKDPICHYTATKAMGEKLVLESNGKGGVLTAAVRICGIFGPRDVLVSGQFLTDETKMGLPFKQDYVYVENVVHAMFCIESHLNEGSEIGGQTFFITNDAPITVQDFNSRMGAYFGQKVTPMPVLLLKVLAYFSETVTRISRGRIGLGKLSMLTPPAVYLSSEYYFSDAKAKKEIGYQPIYSMNEGIETTAAYLKKILGEKK